MATYAHNVLVAFDQFCAVVFFNQPDITVSSLCWIALNRADARSRINVGYAQLRILVGIGHSLEFFWPGHCAGARDSDRGRGARVEALLA